MTEPYPVSPEPQPPAGGGGAQPPSPVRLAVNLIWARIAVSVLSALLTFVFLDDIVDAAMEAAGSTTLDADAARAGAILGVVISLVISVGINVLLAIFIRKGANWARIVFTVLGVLGAIASLLGIANQPALLLVLALVGVALTIAAIVLLFRPESNQYFSGPRAGA